MPLTSSSRTERFKQGKALRHTTPREAHADLKGSFSRNAVALLAESDRDRVPELVPERYARMSLNPFAFLRGAAAVMAADLAAQPMAGIPVQAGGDSHLMNFGAFVTPENNILFDVNDFDETLPDVDFTVDLKRLAASVAVAALAQAHRKSRPGLWRLRPSKPIGRIWPHGQALSTGDMAQPDRPRTRDRPDRQREPATQVGRRDRQGAW
jgi:hypothetical protein